jgi:hypothetical protein
MLGVRPDIAVALHLGRFLFDMDSTLLDATGAIERIRTAWAGGHGVDATRLLIETRG